LSDYGRQPFIDKQEGTKTHKRGVRTDVRPPLFCDECGGIWTEIFQSLRINKNRTTTKIHSIWEFLEDFPTRGCEKKICPKCSKQKYAIYREIK
tara:strand:- start:199 stop:480 length:282 start_codon:yes stop_codon:yes gene_type:complete